ncbi:MAG: substrate-binding domain-containing protein [Chloroflexi bacterium]|nr:substrate-binding domain-containing protein [Chloroflexota bacterium]
MGFIGDAGVATCVARQAGYEEVLRAANLPLRIADGRSRIAGGAAAVEELVRDEEPTALVVANNLMTIGALRVLRARGSSTGRSKATTGMPRSNSAAISCPAGSDGARMTPSARSAASISR